MKDFSACLDIRKCKNWAHKNFSWRYRSDDLFCLFPSLYPEFLSGGVEDPQSPNSLWINPHKGRWPVPIYSWHKGELVGTFSCWVLTVVQSRPPDQKSLGGGGAALMGLQIKPCREVEDLRNQQENSEQILVSEQ